jgi:hypothetical protein
LPALGWYPDPENRHELRFHDGARWTQHVADAGIRDVEDVEIDLRDDSARRGDPGWRSLSIWPDAGQAQIAVERAHAGAGWYPDPSGRHRLRYHDGAAWSDYVSDVDGYRVDPI